MLFYGAALLALVSLIAAALVVAWPDSVSRPAALRAARTPAFVAAQLGARRAATPAVSQPRYGARSEVTPRGFRVRSGAASVSLSSVDGVSGAWTSYASGAARPTGYGQELVTVGRSGAEQLLQVDRRQGKRTWSWRLGTSLHASLQEDGMVAFRGADGRDTGLRITPVELFDTHGSSVTPAGLRWSLARRDGAQFLELRLDDSSLPLPYLIDPSVTLVTFTAPTKVAGATENWTVGFKTSASGALNAGKTITVVFSSNTVPQTFTVPATPTIALGAGFVNCTATATAVSTTVTITLAGASCAVGNSTTVSLTINGLTNPLQATAIAKANFSVMTSVDSTSAVSPGANVTIVAGPFVKLQALMPNEVAAPGTASGKTGAPTARTAGTSFNVTVNAVDANWNKVNTITDTVGLTSSDAQAVLPANVPLVAGTKVLAITLKTAPSQTVTASDVTDGSKTPNTSPSTTVNPLVASKLAATAVPGSATAGTSFSVTVGSQDTYGNAANVTSATGISLAASGLGTLSGNVGTIANATNSITLAAVQYTKAESITLTATRTSGMALAASAASSSFTVNPAAAATLSLSGTPASVTAGNTGSVTVTAKDSFGNVATGYTGTVSFTSTDGAAVLPGSYAFVGGDAGAHTFSNAYTLKTAGSRTVSATDGVLTGTSGSITVSPAAAATFSLNGTPASVTAGGTGSVTVTAYDTYGNVATGFTGTAAFTSNDSLAVLPSNYTFTGGDAGVHAFTNAYTLKTTGSRTVTATSGGVTGTSAGITVNSGPATSLVASAPGSTTAGAGLGVTVTAKDAYGNIATGYTGTVSFTSTDGQAGLPAAYGFVGADNGSRVFTATLKTAPSQTVSVTDGTHNATTGSISVGPGPAASYVVSGPASATAGSGVSVTVTAKDAYGNVATGYTGTVSLTSGDAQASLPAPHAFTGGDAGVHAFPVTLKTAGSQTVSASDGSINATSGSISVDPGSLATLAVSAPATATAGSAVSVTVSGADAYGNATTNYTGTVSLTSSDGQAALPAPHAYTGGDAGTHVFPVTLKTAGAQTVSASDGSISGVSGSVAVSPAAAASLTLAGAPASATAGAGFPVTVTARDAYNNVATGYTGTATFLSTDSQAALPVAYAFGAGDAGTHNFSVTLKTAGPHTVSVSDGALNDTSGAVSVDPAAAATLDVSAPASATAGIAASVTVTAKDAYGNIATGYAGTVGFTSTDAQAALPAPYAFFAGDAGVHAFSATLKTAASETVSASDGSINGTSGSVAVGPGAVSASTSTTAAAPASVVADGSTPVTVTVTLEDAYGNLVPGKAVSVAATGAGAVSPASVVTDGSGVAAFSVTDTAVESSTFTATDTSDSLAVTQTASASFVAGPLWSIAISPSSSAVAAGASQVYGVTGSDAYGHTLGAQTATFSIAPDGSCSDPGASCSATVSGPHTVTATVGGKVDQAALSVSAGAGSGGTTTLVAASSSIVADGASTTAITVGLKDSYGNSLTSGGATVALATTGGTLSSVTDYGDGSYSATLTAPVTPGSATVSGTVNAAPIAATAAVTFTNSDVTAPVLATAIALNGTLTLTYSEPLDTGSPPAPGDFAVLQNLSADAVTSVTVSGSALSLSLSSSVASGDLVTISYTGTATRDLAGNPAATFLNQTVAITGPAAPTLVTCVRPLLVTSDGTQCVPPPPPPPPIRFVGSSPANGVTLTGVDSISLTANHMASWFAISVVNPDGGTTAIASGFGVTYSQPFAATQTGVYTLAATMDDGFNPVQHVTARFTVVPARPDVALPSKSGSVKAASGQATVNWAAGTFADPVSVNADDAPALPGSFGSGTVIVQVTVKRLADGAPLTTFGQPLEVVFPVAPVGGVPSFSEDGKTWSPLPLLSSGTLPPGQVDGYFRDSAGAVHVLTRHLTYFGVLMAAQTKLALSVSGTVTRLPGGVRGIAASVNVTRGSLILAALYAPRGALLQTWKRTVPAGASTVTLIVPASKVARGLCTIVLQATAAGQTTRSTIPVSLR